MPATSRHEARLLLRTLFTSQEGSKAILGKTRANCCINNWLSANNSIHCQEQCQARLLIVQAKVPDELRKLSGQNGTRLRKAPGKFPRESSRKIPGLHPWNPRMQARNYVQQVLRHSFFAARRPRLRGMDAFSSCNLMSMKQPSRFKSSGVISAGIR